MLVWAVSPPVISSKQGEKQIQQMQISKRPGRLEFEKSVCKDISRASPYRYEKDIMIQGGITNSKKVNKIVFCYHVIMCHFLSTDS